MSVFSTTSSELSDLRKGVPYTWGKIIKIHDIVTDGVNYSIVEYAPKPINGVPSKNDREFSGYVNGKCVHGATTFDGALLLCISHNHVKNPNTAVHLAFATCKLLDVATE